MCRSGSWNKFGLRGFLISPPIPLSTVSEVQARKHCLVTVDICVLRLSSGLLPVCGTGCHIPITMYDHTSSP